MQRRLRWFGHAARRPEGELIKDLRLPIPPRTWRRRVGGQLKTWATTIKADLEPLAGPRVFGHDWVKFSIELAQDRHAWSAFETWPTQLLMPAQPAPVNADASKSYMGRRSCHKGGVASERLGNTQAVVGRWVY